MSTGFIKDCVPYYCGDAAPADPISGARGDIERRAQRTWNRFGAALQWVGSMAGIDPLLAAAVLAVESSGRGFTKHPGEVERLLIRFEVHHFWRHWGQGNPQDFEAHFRFDGRRKWTQHNWRVWPGDAWRPVHKSQASEWEVLVLASGLSREAALLSISMGLPQVMGSNHSLLGYPDVREMFEAFRSSELIQIAGFFDFLLHRGAGEALAKEDLLRIAEIYNGRGRAPDYAEWIGEALSWLRSTIKESSC